MASSIEVSTQPERPFERWSSSTRGLLLALPFLVLLYVQLAHHVPWRDELNALAITWASPTISSLFWHIHREGHPWLWYVILWIPSRFTHSVLVLKVVQGIVSTATILVVALRSPFRMWEKALVLAGYFFVFEYTVLSRMYGVMLLLFVIYLWRRTTRFDTPLLSAALLGLMASSEVIGGILSIALVLEYAWFAYTRRNTAPLFTRRAALKAMGIYVILAGFAAWSAMPVPDVSSRTTGKPFADATHLTHLYDALLRYTVLPFLPVKSPRSHFFWNPGLHRGHVADTLPMLLILTMLYVTFRGRSNLLLLVGATILGGTAFGHLIYFGSERHFGIVFLAFVGGLWILSAASPSPSLPMAAYILLAVSAVSSIWAVIASWQRPFSYNQAAAKWITRSHLDAMPLVAEEDTSAAGVAEILHRPVYMVECSCADTYLLFSSRRDNYTPEDLPERVLQASHFYHDVPLLFMEIHPMTSPEKEGLEKEGFLITPLASFSEAEAEKENFYFYRLALIHPLPESAMRPPTDLQ